MAASLTRVTRVFLECRAENKRNNYDGLVWFGLVGSKQKHLGADRETADDSPEETTHGAGADGEADAHAEADDRRRTGDHRERRRGQRVVCYDCGALANVYSNPHAFLFLSLFFARF